MGVMMNETTNIEHEIHELALKIKEELIKRGEMMATAESCTGGLIASSIVNEAGSSAILKGEILEKYGAVSEQTVKAMAEGARKMFNCEWAVATSGIAGPTGAEPGKPVGTVWMCVANSLQNEAFYEIFTGNRGQIREKSVLKIMGKLLFLLNNQKSTCTKVH
jgi:nicotinamide-nucleotide amidase